MSVNCESTANIEDNLKDVRSKDYLLQFPQIVDNFEIIDKIGEGSFASVFSVKSKTNPCLKEKFALKFTIPTINPKRIENELRILKKIGGRKNVIKLHLSFRVRDRIFMLMPLVEHLKFVDYYLMMDVNEIREYLRNLLIALMHVHDNEIIHRDVKPNNFLYDRNRKKFTLVDFGLAHSEKHGDLGSWFEEDNNLDMSGDKLLICRLNSGSNQREELDGLNNEVRSGNTSCICGNRLSTCNGCRSKPRPEVRRGGTIGYRPPEVMMRHTEQTTAVDVWAVGIIMAIFITGRYPFLRADDDLEVFYGLLYFLSLEKMQAAARQIGRQIVVNPKPKPLIGEIVYWLQARCTFIRQRCPKIAKLCADGSNASCTYGPAHVFDESAYDLLSHLLDPSYRTRFTCREALKHSFFRANLAMGDSNFR